MGNNNPAAIPKQKVSAANPTVLQHKHFTNPILKLQSFWFVIIICRLIGMCERKSLHKSEICDMIEVSIYGEENVHVRGRKRENVFSLGAMESGNKEKNAHALNTSS